MCEALRFVERARRGRRRRGNRGWSVVGGGGPGVITVIAIIDVQCQGGVRRGNGFIIDGGSVRGRGMCCHSFLYAAGLAK